MANGHGGRRHGAGRPKGSGRKQRTVKAAPTSSEADLPVVAPAPALAGDDGPIDIMLKAAEALYARGDYLAAANAASKAAPYLYNRFAPMDDVAKMHRRQMLRDEAPALPEEPDAAQDPWAGLVN